MDRAHERETASDLTCPICQVTGARPRYHVRGYTVLACPGCGGWYLPLQAGQGATYDDDYLRRGRASEATHGYFDYERDRALHLRNFQRNLEILGEFGAAGALCDVGCASGHFLMAARASGRFTALTGVDPSHAAVAAVRERLGCAAVAGLLGAMPAPGRYDVLTLWETIEHIPRPVEALAAARAWLRPGGLLAVGTGDNTAPLARLLGRRWWYLVPPDHCVYFNRRALTIALTRAGYEIVGWRRIWTHWVSGANATMKLLRSLDLPPAKALAAAGALAHVALPIVHGTTLVALARPSQSP